MASRRNKIEIIVEAKDRATANLNNISSGLQRLDQFAGIAGKGFLAFAGAQAVGDLAATGFELAKLSAQSIEVEKSFRQLARGIGASSDEVLSKLREASRGTIDDTTLQLNANRAFFGEIVKDADQLARLLEAVAARGKAASISTQKAFEIAALGIGRLSPQRLDDIGVNIDASVFEDYAKSVGKAADELTDFEKKQVLVNKIIAESQDLINAQGEAATGPYDRLAASIENLKDAFGRSINPGISSFADAAATGAQRLADGIVSFTSARQEFFERFSLGVGGAEREVAALEGQLARLIEGRNRLLEDKEQGSTFFNPADLERQNDLIARTESQLKAAQVQLAQLNAKLILATGGLGQMSGGTDQLRDSLGPLPDKIEEAGLSAEFLEQRARLAGQGMSYMADLALAAGEDVDAFSRRVSGALANVQAEFALINRLTQTTGRSVANAAGGVVDIIGKEGALNLAQKQLSILEDQTQELRRQGVTGLDLQLTMRELENELLGPFDQIRKNQEATKDWGDTVTSSVSSAFDQLKSKISGVLSGAIGPVAGVDANDLLPRQDAINEDARRLADVAVNGFASPWADYLNNKFPELFQGAFESGGDLKTAAALALRDFQDGLNVQLLDKEKAKERVRKMLIGDQRLSDLAGEIASELSSEFGNLGIGDIQTAARAALGVGGGEEEGQGVGQSFASGAVGAVSGGNPGTQMLNLLKGQLGGEGNITAFSQLGATIGTAWSTGFLNAAQVAKQLSENFSSNFNLGNVEAATREALAVGSAEGEGSTLGQSFSLSVIAAVADSNPGTQMINLLKAELKAESNISTIKEAGRLLGNAWGQGFLDTVGENIPPQLIDILVNLVIPGVAAQQQQQASLTAAGS